MVNRPKERKFQKPHYLRLVDTLEKHPDQEMSQHELSKVLKLDKTKTRRASVYAEKKGLVRVVRSKSLALKHVDGNVLLRKEPSKLRNSAQAQKRHAALKFIYGDRHRGY